MLFKSWYTINDYIKIYIPIVDEVVANEEEYDSLVQALTAMPIDLMAQLDDVGIDFTEITDYDLFLMMFESIKSKDTRLVFGDLNLSKFELAINPENQAVVLYDEENDFVIDRALYGQIADVLRKINCLEKNRRKPANKEAKEYLIKRAKLKLKRKKRQPQESQLEPLIIAMVNTKEYKYDFEGTRNLTIYQFNKSVRQVIDKVDYDNIMFGVYTGNINPKELNQKELNWLTHK